MRHRRVFCQGFEGREVSDADCPAAEKPSTSDVCDMGSCSTNTWFFTEWSGQVYLLFLSADLFLLNTSSSPSMQCSEECGTGIQTRKAHCSGSSEADCDAAKKPDITRTCVSSKDCNGKWFTGPWSQVKAFRQLFNPSYIASREMLIYGRSPTVFGQLRRRHQNPRRHLPDFR